MPVVTLSRFTVLYFYTGVALFLGFVAARQGLSLGSSVLFLTIGFISWGFIEYGLHRFIFHYDARSSLGRKLLYYAHISHHENPKAKSRFLASMVLSTPIAAAYWLLAWTVTGSRGAAYWLFIGMTAGYFCYEWLHFQCHHGRSRLRLLRYLRMYHLLHHYRTPEMRFGVTSPLFDLVFGTFAHIRTGRRTQDPSAA